MNPILKKSYQREYENSDITIEELKKKHNVKDFGDTSNWHKKIVIDVEVDEKPKTKDLPEVPSNSEEDTIKEDLEEAKKLIVKESLRILREEVDGISIKEFKDVVSIVDQIDKNVNDKKDISVNNLTVITQNLISKYS